MTPQLRRRRRRIEWSGDEEFDLGGRRFVCRPVFRAFESTPERLCLRKARWSVERYAELIDEIRPDRILEIGVAGGASAAMLMFLAQPSKLVAADISADRAPALDALIEAEGWKDRVRVHYGIDQVSGDLAAIAKSDLDGGADLIIDDASHELSRTRTTFERLFPLLDQGGRYLIEDWSWAHAPLPYRTDQPELSRLAFELTIACAVNPELITDIEINRGWLLVRRGPTDLEGGFDLRDHLGERGAALLARLNGSASG